jgi:hypothetical protein
MAKMTKSIRLVFAKVAKPLFASIRTRASYPSISPRGFNFFTSAEKHVDERIPGEPWTQAEKEYADEVIQRFFDEDR